MNMLEVIHVATVAWQAVSQDTILNCFHHAELKKKQPVKLKFLWKSPKI